MATPIRRLRLSDELYAQANERAEQDGITFSELIRTLLTSHLGPVATPTKPVATTKKSVATNKPPVATQPVATPPQAVATQRPFRPLSKQQQTKHKL